ncbi:hypothetical protein K440DRAFT_663512 [Wilcoxina mikolae CBS 423.85]|nr:hypothetical protein K440DRAFT_663512 [Wilcoxina mikolae CBS 423.85]
MASPAKSENSTVLNGIPNMSPIKTQRRFAPRRRKPKTAGGGYSILNLTARLIAWYALYTVLFRCPAHPTPDSPGICHPAHTIKTAVRPHIQPYYDAYVFPYVQQYSPYIQEANKDYIIPTYTKVRASYHQYAEPYVTRSSDSAVAVYKRFLGPHVATAQSKMEDYITIYVSPHAETANKVWINDVKPTVDVTEEKVEVFFKDNVLPKYNRVHPYLAKLFEQVRYVVTAIVAPIVKEGGEKAVGWGRGMWSEVVRPQVGRIGERLGGTNGNGVPANAVSSSLFSSLSAAKPSKGASAASISSMVSVASAAKASESAAGSSEKVKKLSKEEEREMIEQDLIAWTAKFRASSDKTLADLKIQIDNVAEKAYNRKRKSVETDLTSLQRLVDDGFTNLKAEIVSLTKQLTPESSSDAKNAAEEKLFTAARHLGTEIRDKAQYIRKDAEKCLAKVYDDVSEAADQHLVVLDGINDMGMQELGMKWAWMDYVTYKDWAKYHDLKKQMKESRSTIIKSAESNEELVKITQWIQDEWEGKATDIAKAAAEELNRVKKVGKKKIELADTSDNFTDDHIPVAAKKAGQAILGGTEKLKIVVEGTIKDTAEEAKLKIEEIVIRPSSTPASESIISAASEAVQNVASQASEKIYGTEPNAAEKVATAVSEAVDSASSIASTATDVVKAKVPGGVEAGFVANAESVLYEDGEDFVDGVQSRLAEASKAVSQAVLDAVGRGTTTTPLPESLQSRASELHASAISVASSILHGTPTPVTEEWASIATDKYSSAVAAASSILYGTPTPTYEMLIQKAKEAYARATEAAGDSLQAAKSLAVTTDKPIQESMYSVASEKYSSALSVADASYSSILSAGAEAKKKYDAALADAQYRQKQAEAAASIAEHREHIMNLAHEKFLQAAEDAEKTYNSWYYAASSQIYGTPAPSGVSASAASLASEAAESIASASDSAQELAALRYAELQSLVNELIYGKEPTFSESVMNRFSSALYGTPAPLLSRVSSVAASATEAVASMPPAIDAMVSDAISRVKAAAAEASTAVYGKEPTQIEKYQQRLRILGQEAVDSISVAVYGTEKSTFEKATETAASMASQASENVAYAASQASSAASSVGVKLGFVEEEKAYKDQLIENARKRIWSVIESAEEALRSVGECAEGYARQAEEAYESVKEKVRDEL